MALTVKDLVRDKVYKLDTNINVRYKGQQALNPVFRIISTAVDKMIKAEEVGTRITEPV